MQGACTGFGFPDPCEYVVISLQMESASSLSVATLPRLDFARPGDALVVEVATPMTLNFAISK